MQRVISSASGMGVDSRKRFTARCHHIASLKMNLSSLGQPQGAVLDGLLCQFFGSLTTFPRTLCEALSQNRFCLYELYVAIHVILLLQCMSCCVFVFVTNHSAYFIHNLRVILGIKCLLWWISNVNHFVHNDSQ